MGSADGAIKLYDIRGGFVTHVFRSSSGVVSALHFFELSGRSTPTSKSKKKGQRQRDQDEDEEMADIVNGDNEPSTMHLASGGEDGKVRIWNLAQRKCVGVLDSHVSVVRDLDFSPVEDVLLSGGRDKTVILWDVLAKAIKRVIPVLETVEACGFVGERYVYTGGEKGTLRIWDRKIGSEVTKDEEAGLESDAIQQIVHNLDQGFLLSVHTDQSLILHSTKPLIEPKQDSLDSLPIIRRISGTHDEIIDLAYITPERSMLALATNSESIRIITADSSSLKGQAPPSVGKYFGADVASLTGHSDIIICLSVDWSGCWLATGSKDNTARIWRIDATNNSFECTAILKGHTESVGAICLPCHVPAAPPT